MTPEEQFYSAYRACNWQAVIRLFKSQLARVRELEEALKPFAEAADAETASHRQAFEDGDYALSSRKSIDESAYVIWGDLRRAAKVLKGKNGGD